MKRRINLPIQLLVAWEGEPPDQYLAAHETNSRIEDGTEVGIYRLESVRRQKVTEELVPLPKRKAQKKGGEG